VERAAAALASAQGRIGLARDRRIPLAEQALRSTLAAYQGGKENFNEVLTAFRDVRTAREEYHAAVSDHLKAWAALEWATGGELSVPDSKN
jgi:outer membrane protein TolC